uniref:MIT domain-containing protein n=1 Tax=Mola mola TaxID=94237 RepID=A0A3Q4ACJ4_MOLML
MLSQSAASPEPSRSPFRAELSVSRLLRIRTCAAADAAAGVEDPDYLVEAAKQIRMALDSEVNEDYEAAFSYYKNGVDLLLNGVQLDPNKERREAVKRKTTQYLKRAEEIFITHFMCSLSFSHSK